MPPPNAARNARMRAVSERAKRPLSVLISFINGQAVPYSPYGVNQFLLEGLINLASQIAELDIHHVGLVEIFIASDVLGNLCPGEHAARFTQQAFQHRK